ncbi:MAG: asparaginyl-tRNA synthetase [Piccolia ochrophora]|nr:MAG: asparaginyl-tRNA synthetase [Piccolia ochrophora]
MLLGFGQNYPLQKKYQSAEYLRTLPHLRARSTFNALLLRLRSYSIAHLTAFFATRGFVQTHPPIVTSSDCEGAGEVFTVSAGSSRAWAPKDSGLDQDAHFFRHPKYLTVSSQLHLEALAHSVGKVWTLSPTFRAERSDTARHLSEFYMLEAEASFVDELEDIMALVESTLQDIATILPHSAIGEELLSVKRATETGEDEDQSVVAETLQSRWSGLARKSWPRVTYTEVVMLLREAVEKNEISFDFPPTWESGLQAEHERYITQTIGSKGPVFVTDYPQHLKAFYMLPSASTHSTSNAPGPTVSCFDLLLPDVCEVAGGSLREHRLPELLHAMHRHGLIRTSDPALLSDDDLGSLKWYVDLRRWGTVPHGGFGLGFDRLLGYLAGVSNVREVVTFPRWVGRCDC